MKQAKMLFLSLTVLAMLFAGGCTNTNKGDDGSTSSPVLNTPQAETQKPPSPTPDESVEKLTYTGNAPDESLISVDYATEELLAQYKSYEEFYESENTENQAKILFEVSTAVKDFRLLMIHFDETGEHDSLNFCVHKTLYSKDTISPEKPLVVGTVFEGSFPTRAISFVDEDNTTRYYAVNLSGKDGSLILLELVPREDT